MRVAGAAEPDVGLGVVFFGDELGQRLARALERQVDPDAGGLCVDRGDHVAPIGLHRADHVDLLGRHRTRRNEQHHRTKKFFHVTLRLTLIRHCKQNGPLGPRVSLSKSGRFQHRYNYH
jgi:hypothetical protein